jgi:hypothetical protein
MNGKDKETMIKFVLIYFFVFGILSVIGGLIKTSNLFYHQVILKDQIAGEVNKK